MILGIKRIAFIILFLFGYYYFFNTYNNIILIENLANKNFIQEKKKIKEFAIIQNKDQVREKTNLLKKETKLKKFEIVISKGDTFLSILQKFEIPEKRVFELINKISNFFSLNKLKVNDKIIFFVNPSNEIEKIYFELDIDSMLIVYIGDEIIIEEKELEKLSYKVSREFKISESLYRDGIENNLPQDILIKLIKLFSFDLDFQRDIKENTIVSVSYEFNEIKENNKFEYKDIRYALINIDGKKLEYFKFITDDGYLDYFNRDGKNVKKSILKTPLDGARLSSNFGMRKHPISGYNKMHKGVDFAAPKGTPIYAGGNGVIEYIGNNGGYGKYIRIRHNNEYKTAYAHLSGYKKGISKGVRVNQGDIIGYVGSTGISTGPHLHYEILFQNQQINPLKMKLPSGKILKNEEFERFKKEYKEIYADHLNLLFE